MSRRALLRFQLVVWSLLTTVIALPATHFHSAGWRLIATWIAVWALFGMLLTSGLAVGYARLPDALLRGFRAVGVTLGACFVASGVWTLALWGVEPLIGREPWAPPEIPEGSYVALTYFRGIFVLGLWSALYLVGLLSERMQRARADELEARALAGQMQLELLRSQINPHFLFNALNSVVALIGENPRGARNMVRNIATLLRRSLDADGRKDTTVEAELSFVRLYLECEQVRFESRLQVELTVDPTVGALPMPPMLLHPLVENAIKHGMPGAAEAPLRVQIRVRREAPFLVFEVVNNGSIGSSAEPIAGPGIGLRNVRGRLAHHFPGRHQLELGEQDGLVTARLAIPLPGGA